MKKILILSGKGGTGKTTLATALIRLANIKAIADCDVDAPNLHILNKMVVEPKKMEFIGSEKAFIDNNKCINCGLCKEYCRFNAIDKTKTGYKIKTYACEGCGVCNYICPNDAIIMKDDISGTLYLYKDDKVFSTAKLKMGRGNSGKLVSAVKNNLDENAKDMDLAIIDGSPGIGCPVIASISGVDLVLIVAEPSLSGLEDLQRIVETARIFNPILAVCVNKYDINKRLTGRIKSYCEKEKIAFIGEIPYDKKTSILINEGKSLIDEDSLAKESILGIYANLKILLK